MAYFDQFYGPTGASKPSPSSGGKSSTGSTFFDDFYDDEKRKKKYGEVKAETKPLPKTEKITEAPKETSFFDKVKDTTAKAGKVVSDFLFGEPGTFMQQKAPNVEKLKSAGFTDKEINGLTLTSYQKLKESEDRILSLKENLSRQRLINEQVGKGVKVDKSQRMPVEIFSSKEREIKALEDEADIYRQLTGAASTNKGFFKRMVDMFDTPVETFQNLTPYVKNFVDSEENKRMLSIENKLKNDTPLSDEEKSYVKRRDAKVIQAYIDKGFGDVVAESIAPNTSYMVDFALTGGVYGTGKKAVEATLTKAPKIISSLAGGIVGSLLQGSVRIPVIAKNVSDYMLPRYDLVAGDKGTLLIKKLDEGDSFNKALAKGYASAIIETTSEHMGAIVEDGGDFVKKAILSRFGVLNKVASPKQLFDIAEKVGWNGIIPEVFEEYAQYFLQAPIDKTKIELPDPTRLVGRKDLETAMPDLFTQKAADQFLVTTVSVAMQGLMMNTTQGALNKALDAKTRGDRPVLDVDIKDDTKAEQGQEKPKSSIPSVITNEVEKRQELSSIVNNILTDQERTAVEMIKAGTSSKEIMKEVGDNAFGQAEKSLDGETGSVSYLLDTYANSKNDDIKSQAKTALDTYFKNNPESEQMTMYKEVMGDKTPSKLEITPDIKAEIEAIQRGKSEVPTNINEEAGVLTAKNDNVQENTTPTENIAESVLSYVDKDGKKVYTTITKDELSILKNETENIPDGNGKESQIHLDPLKDNIKGGAREVSREEFAANHSQVAGVLDNVKTMLEEGQTEEKVNSSVESKKDLLLNATIGKGEYKGGEIYYQDVGGTKRGVIIESVDNEGVRGYYLPTPSPSKILGNDATLEPVLFTKPSEELKVTKGTDAKIRELLKQRFFPNDNVEKPPAEEGRVVTPKDAAIKLIEAYVLRGDSLQSLKNGNGGTSNSEFSAQIGGYSRNGKNYSADNILVEKINGKEVNEVFSLKKIYDEIAATAKETTTPKVEDDKKKYQNKLLNLFRGTNVKGDAIVSSAQLEFDRVLVVNEGQAQLLNTMIGSGIAVPQDVWEIEGSKPRWSVADPFIRDYYKKNYDAIVYENQDRPQLQGYEVHSLGTGDFYASNEQLAKLYAMQKRGAKYQKELQAPAEQVIIQSQTNEATNTGTNQLIGQEGVPDTSTVGEGRPINTPEVPRVVSEGVGGNTAISSTSTGDRPTARVATTIQEIIDQHASVDKVTGEVSIEMPINKEQEAILRAYTPAGGMEKQGADGRGLLDEYYTPKSVVDAMWNIIKKYVPLTKDTRILEPAAGIGAFIDSVNGVADVTALEINEETAKITQLLHPQSQVFNKQFETLFVTDRGSEKVIKEEYDVVVGNPPYGEHRGRYLGLGEEAKVKKYEEYFIKRGLDITKPDGVVAMLVPSGILRTTLSASKERIASLGELVLAYRFPNGIFDKTDIGTDLLVFRKKATSEDTEIYKRQNMMSNDNYFTINSNNVLGQQDTKRGRFGEEKVVTGSLDEAIDRLSRIAGIDVNVPIQEISTSTIVSSGTNPPTETFTDDPNVETKPRVKTEEAKKEVQRTIDKNVTIVSTKKSPPLSLSSVKPSEIAIWQNTVATGELSSEFVSSLKVTDTKLFENNDISVEFDNGKPKFYTNFMYEQGNIYEKLGSLERNKENMSDGQYQRQKKALEAILPVALDVNNIQLQPTSQLIDDIEITIVDEEPRKLKDMFVRWMRSLQRDAYEDSGSYEVEGYIDGSIVNSGDKELNIEIRKRRRRVGNKLFQRFVENELNDDQKAIVADKYNRSFNGFVRPDYRKIPLIGKVHSTFKKGKMSFRPLQIEGAAFLTTKGVGLLGYDTGVGKTLTGILAINEAMARGFTKRPLIIVPNGTYLDWMKNMMDVIPGVKINSLQNLGSKFKGDLTKFKVADGTISIMSYEGLRKLGFKQETYDRLLGDLQDTISGVGQTTERGKEKEKAKADEFIGEAMKKTTDQVFFEDLNFDHVTIDEVQNFKNIFVGAKLEKGKGNEYRNVHGSSSERGKKAYLLTQHILGENNGRNVHLLSATPFSNSPLEIYSILSLMAKKKLEDMGLKNVNEFMSMFMDLKPTYVVKADQSVMEEDVVDKYINLQQLQQIVTQYIDFRTGDDAGIYRPKKFKKKIVLHPTQNQLDMMKMAEELFAKKKDGGVIQGITELQNITLSPYLSRYARNGEGASTSKDDTNKKYYINKMTEKGSQFFEVDGTPIIIEPWIETFIHKGGQAKWTVSEATAGLYIGQGDTRALALSRAKENLERVGKEETIARLKKRIEDVGASPRVTGIAPVAAEGEEAEVKYLTLPYNYKSFVSESPKIRYAMDMIEQNKKDSGGAGQIIYMPRGVQFFSFLRQYLTLDLKYKANEVAIIQGGMSIDEKQAIQDGFNAGTIKILIGTEAIKEGVNIQENATDMYWLHLPWNPTDIKQGEGRVERFGNRWKSVRIHYPLIENSVDAFIFQKLETKEKRLKSVWSYKGGSLEIGDLDFEDMKLDLITDPVKRVEAERAFAKSVEGQRLAVMKSELSFLRGYVEKWDDAQADIKYAEARVEKAKTEQDTSDYEYYKKDLAKGKEKLARVSNIFTRIDTNIDQVKMDALAKEKQITEQQTKIDGLKDEFEAKIEKAKTVKRETRLLENDYKALVEEIKETNKEFFVKADMKAPSGTASMKNYAIDETTQSLLKEAKKYKTAEALVDERITLQSIEMPEMVALAREISGNTPLVKKLVGKQGDFTGPNRIRLSADIFKDPILAARVLAHEIGHLIDYIPEGTLSRGNILGRINSLQKFLKGVYGELNNKEVREELKALTMKWAPFDVNADEGYRKYRHSSKELYADAISVLFNDPEMLKRDAPVFWQGFFDNLEKKPDVKFELFETWNLLMKGEEALLNERDQNINEMFKRGDDIIIAKSVEQKAKKDDYWFKLKFDMVDRNQKVIDDIARAKKKGAQISDDHNPQYMLEEHNYVGGVVKAFVVENVQPIFKKVKEAGIEWTDFGKVLFLERVINERSELANPLGQTKDTAERQLIKLEQTIGSEKYAKLQTYIEQFRNNIKSVLDQAQESGFYSSDLVDELKANPSYATFQVLDYLDLHVDARVKQQIGTLKEIANPADSMIQKTISLIKAIERNKTKTTLITFYKENFSGEVVDAKYMWNGKTRVPVDTHERDLGLVTLYEKGKLRGYYVDKYIASTVNITTSGHVNAILGTLRFFNSKLYRPLFITFNTGFQTFNAVRDFTRFYKNVPNLPLWRAFLRYGQAVKPAFLDAINQPSAIIQEMEKLKMLSVTYNDVLSGKTEIDSQIDLIMSKYGSMTQKQKLNIFAPITAVFDLIEKTGNFIERLPKIAAYLELDGKLPSHELAQFIRTKAGSPDFLRRGNSYAWSNDVFLFSNSIKEGLRADLEIATDPKTRGGFWFKTAMVNLLPKIIMFAAIQGFLGPVLKKMLESMSEYDRTNYITVPMGFDETGKLMYLRIPQDETGRFIASIFWKSLRMTNKDRDALKDAQEILSIGGGQFPSLTPSIGTMIALTQFAFGQNPYDFFRNRNVIPDQEFKAGGMYKLKPFATWMFGQLGGSVLLNTYVTEQMPSSKSWQQKVLELPIISNVMGRWIKVSDYGVYEKTREIELGVEQRKAQEGIENKAIITSAIKEYASGPKSLFRKQDIEKAMIVEILGHKPKTPEEKTKATNAIKKFRVAVVQGEYDTLVDRFFTAGSNEEKLIYLKEIKSSRSTEKYRALIKVLKKEKLISENLLKLMNKQK